MRWITVFGIVLLAFPLKISAFEATPIIQTTKGPVQGEVLYSVWKNQPYYSFKGIPYAAPPVGPLRFKPTVEVDPWTEVLNTTVEGSVCPQLDFIFNNPTGSEDCLYLNVYVPLGNNSDNKCSKNLKPVMFWIHGGSFTTGYGNSNVYGPEFFMDEDVIVVTHNYRLGALGFLSLGRPDALGNAGLKDQVMALKWVQKNIAKFGGDPKQVTIFGQSAGAVSVEFHLLSDKSKGLFERSISMSGSTLCIWGFHTPKDAENRAFTLGSRVGCNTTDKGELIRCLEKVPARLLVEITDNMTLADPVFKPTLENASAAAAQDIFMTECSMKKYTSGNFNKLPRMMGFVSEETLSFAAPVTKLLDYLDAGSSLVNSSNELSSLEHINSKSWISPQSGKIQNLTTEAFYELVAITTDLLFKAPIDVAQQLMSEYNEKPIYYYEFDYNTEYSYHRLVANVSYNGTGHADDVFFIFDPTILGIPTDLKMPLNQFRMRVVRLWANFAKFGNPTPDGTKDPILNVVWPDSTPSGKQLIISTNLTVADRQVNSRTKIIESAIRLTAPTYTGCDWQDAVPIAASMIKNLIF